MSTPSAGPSPMEARLAGYWQELLGVDSVRPEDHFLEVGGNSLLATLLANRIEDDLGLQVGMVDLFNTLSAVAAVCERLQSEAQAAG
ncbi:phosphopantetheine-binding protein [Corallococcus sp. RDP092CA]|uniref:phosphopantetheine-binding protein n=1 Tax=Corallococcus sp. RDP092CA TaxID=3109369 RepID=UPI0035ADF580